ncbi:MAG: response regulator transcription factor [Bdellovibrio sp.]|nr:response regulator transcription factor [Bdellovibrio sp.]
MMLKPIKTSLFALGIFLGSATSFAGQCTVLVVEDNLVIRQLIERWFQLDKSLHQCLLLFAADHAAAIVQIERAEINRTEFDVVLVDHDLEDDHTGVEVLTRLWKSPVGVAPGAIAISNSEEKNALLLKAGACTSARKGMGSFKENLLAATLWVLDSRTRLKAALDPRLAPPNVVTHGAASNDNSNFTEGSDEDRLGDTTEL